MKFKSAAYFLAVQCLFLCLCACRGSLLEENDLEAARNAYTDRNLPLTERLLERYLREEQNSEKRWQAWQLLLQAINADRLHARASLECLDAMLVEYENQAEKLAAILPMIGQYNKDLHHYQEAAEAWNSFLELPDLDDAQRILGYRQLAAMQFQQRHYVASEDTLQQCLSLPVEEKIKISCMLDLAEENMLRDNMEEVKDLALEVIESNPDEENYARASYLLGDALEFLGKPSEALDWFEKALKAYPNPLVIENRIEHLKKKEKK